MATLYETADLSRSPFKRAGLSEQMFRDADLILLMTRTQRRLLVELWPAAVRRKLRCEASPNC
jgi:protein-tyrosine-phosphatase